MREGNLQLTASNTTTNVVALTADSLTTGKAIDISTSSTGLALDGIKGNLLNLTSTGVNAAGHILATIDNQSTDKGNCLYLKSASNGTVFQIDGNGNTTANSMAISSNATTTGIGVAINANALTTGNDVRITSTSTTRTSGNLLIVEQLGNSAGSNTGTVAYFHSTDTGATARSIVEIRETAGNAAGGTALKIQEDGNGVNALLIDKNGSGIAIDVDGDCNTAADIFAIRTNLANAGAGVEYLLDMDGGEVVSAAVGGSQDKKIRVRISGTDYYIPCHTA